MVSGDMAVQQEFPFRRATAEEYTDIDRFVKKMKWSKVLCCGHGR